MASLAVDLGGTKVLFQLTLEHGEVLHESELASEDYKSFSDALKCFLQHERAQGILVKTACIAVAGPVNGTQARVTNLPWQIDANELENTFSITKVLLCNDFEAVGYGIDHLADDELITLQKGELSGSTNVRAVIGAGTGLGQAILTKTDEKWLVMPTEGGHVDFAPTTARQIVLLEHLIERFGHVSYERLLSGAGLVIIYEFLRSYLQKSESAALRNAMINGDAAAAISDFANQQHDPLAIEAMKMFFEIYGAQVANLALACLPYGGIYIAGGIAAKNLHWFEKSEFLAAFHKKGKMTSLMGHFPVHVIKQPHVGLKGARSLAQQILV